MYASNQYVIYEATASDAVKIWYLSQITGQPRLRDRVLIGDIQGAPSQPPSRSLTTASSPTPPVTPPV